MFSTVLSANLRGLNVEFVQVEADVSKLTEATGWERKFELQDTLEDILGYWRGIV